MNDLYCSTTANPAPAAACPTNHLVGRPVGLLTLRSLLALPLTVVSSAQEYRFCSAPDCPTVYYGADGKQVFSETDLRERVYQKHIRSDAVPVCYCFQHTVGEIRDDLKRTGTSTIVDGITEGIRAGQCACDIRNPQGSCCLGNVLDLVRDLAGKTPLIEA
jgi:hypothetical protein